MDDAKKSKSGSLKPKVPEKQRLDTAERLKSIYSQKLGSSRSQDKFGSTSGIGTQGMVNQYLNGTRPLSIAVAVKFAKALNCKIEEFSPEIASQIMEAANYVSVGAKNEWPFGSADQAAWSRLTLEQRTGIEQLVNAFAGSTPAKKILPAQKASGER